jgi:hypothetical protein
MRRSTFARDLLGTLAMFVALLMLTFLFILGEHYLENFKSH